MKKSKSAVSFKDTLRSSSLSAGFLEMPEGMKTHVPLDSSCRSDSKGCLKIEGCNSSPDFKGMKKSVSFNNIEISEYPMELGDNPSCTGVPVTIGWEADTMNTFELDEYERLRSSPRTKQEFRLPPMHRRQLLLSSGITMKEMEETRKESQKIQTRRRNSVQTKKWDKVHYAFEKTTRKLKKVSSLVTLTSSPTNLLTQHASSPQEYFADNDAAGDPLMF